MTIVPANPGFFVLHARPGEIAPYEIFSRLSIIAWRIDDESQIPPEPVTPEGVCRHNSDSYPRAVLHPNDFGRTYPYDQYGNCRYLIDFSSFRFTGLLQT